jgi:hypothetical protein
MTLFECFPDHCVVLLEDIDSAGIRRETMRDILNSLDDNKKSTAMVILSGLLNILDGPASVEGLLVIMTSMDSLRRPIKAASVVLSSTSSMAAVLQRWCRTNQQTVIIATNSAHLVQSRRIVAYNADVAHSFLLTHLYQFFAALLGCSQFGNTVRPYAGTNGLYKYTSSWPSTQRKLGTSSNKPDYLPPLSVSRPRTSQLFVAL